MQCCMNKVYLNLAWHSQLEVETQLAVFHSSVYFRAFFCILRSSKEQNLVYEHMGLEKHSCDAKTYCTFLFNSLDTAYRTEISFTLTAQFYK